MNEKPDMSYIVRLTFGTCTTYLGIILGRRLTGLRDRRDVESSLRGDLDLLRFSFSSRVSLSSDFNESRLSRSSRLCGLSRSRSNLRVPPDLRLSLTTARAVT